MFEPSRCQPIEESRTDYREGSNLFNVNSCRHNLHIVERELGSLGDNIAIDNDHRTPVVVQSIAVAALLICIEIDASAL